MMTRGKIPVVTGDEVKDFLKHIAQMHIEDRAHCGVSFLQKKCIMAFYCYLSSECGMPSRLSLDDNPLVLYRMFNKELVPNKEMSFWELDDALDKWKAQACSKCKCCLEFRKKNCNCFTNTNVRRFSNALLKSIKSNGKSAGLTGHKQK